MRSQELKALGEAINILTGDEARDLFGKTLSFLQTGNVGAQKGANVQRGKADAARNQAVMSAMKKILRAAHRHQNWALATLAVRVRLDPFTKVHEAMDKMLADLKEQQKAEVKKMDYCKTEIDTTEDAIKTKSQEKEDLEGKKLSLENAIASLETEVEELKKEVADMQVSLKQAGEDRKAENTVFQQSVADQRATIQIIQKAKARLAKFYEKGSLVQTGARQPGQTGGAGGVLQLLAKVISDAEVEVSSLITAENYA